MAMAPCQSKAQRQVEGFNELINKTFSVAILGFGHERSNP